MKTKEQIEARIENFQRLIDEENHRIKIEEHKVELLETAKQELIWLTETETDETVGIVKEPIFFTPKKIER